jgi:hypothetical protein
MLGEAEPRGIYCPRNYPASHFTLGHLWGAVTAIVIMVNRADIALDDRASMLHVRTSPNARVRRLSCGEQNRRSTSRQTTDLSKTWMTSQGRKSPLGL